MIFDKLVLEMATTGLKTYLNQFWQRLNCPGRHWGSLQHSPRPLAAGEGLAVPPQEPYPCLRPSGLAASTQKQLENNLSYGLDQQQNTKGSQFK